MHAAIYVRTVSFRSSLSSKEMYCRVLCISQSGAPYGYGGRVHHSDYHTSSVLVSLFSLLSF